MRSTIKIAVALSGMFVATLFSMVIANNSRQVVNCASDLCHLSQRVEFFQNQLGETIEVNFIDKNEMSRYQLNAQKTFIPGMDRCMYSSGNCSPTAKAGHYVAIISN